MAAGLGRSRILGESALRAGCVQQGDWSPELGGRHVLFPVCVCVCVCVYVSERQTVRDRETETEVWEEGEIPFLLPGALPGQNEVHWFSLS